MKRIVLFVLLLVATIGYAKQPLTIWVAGDNTAADQVDLSSPARGWAQVLPTYLNDLLVMNLAAPEEGVASFLDSERWNYILTNAKKKDIILIQFGLNDLDPTKGRAFSTIEAFEHHLLNMVLKAQKAHLTVILTTPVSRMRRNADQQFYPSFGLYAEATRRVAERTKVPLIDLEKKTAEELRFYTEQQSDELFADGVNLTEKGALWVAQLWAQEAASLKVLEEHINLYNHAETLYTTPVTLAQ